MKITANNPLAAIRMQYLQKENPCCWEFLILAQQGLDRGRLLGTKHIAGLTFGTTANGIPLSIQLDLQIWREMMLHGANRA